MFHIFLFHSQKKVSQIDGHLVMESFQSGNLLKRLSSDHLSSSLWPKYQCRLHSFSPTIVINYTIEIILSLKLRFIHFLV